MTAFARAQKLVDEGIKVVAASVDSEEHARKMAEECGIRFPLAYGAHYKAISALTGCFYEERRKIVHATGYVIGPDQKIVVGVYSSGAIGRLVWQDVLALVQSRKQR